MSQNVTGKVTLQLVAQENLATGLGSGPVQTIINFALALANGTGANNIQENFSASSTPAASTPDTWVLSALVDGAGRTVAFAKVRVLALINTGTQPLVVGNAGTHPWAAPFNGVTTAEVEVRPGGVLLIVAPDATALAVTSGSSDQLKVDPGASPGAYQIFIVGE